MAETLFDKYGGFDTFTVVVKNFYTKVLDSNQVSHYFDGINIDRLITHQTNFISKVLGGPDRYEGLDMKKAHAKFNIKVPDFVEVAELLQEALEEAGVEEADVTTIIKTVATLQDQIVSA